MIKYLAPLVLILLIGCNKFELPKKTYFGGKIINPKTGYVILSDNYNFNDTIYLKKDNSFLSSSSFSKSSNFLDAQLTPAVPPQASHIRPPHPSE